MKCRTKKYKNNTTNAIDAKLFCGTNCHAALLALAEKVVSKTNLH